MFQLILAICNFICGIKCLTSEEALPGSITLRGTIRDFSLFHLDFEANVDAKREQKGLLSANLTNSPDDRPSFIPPNLRTDDSLTIFLDVNSDQANYTRYALSNYGQFYHNEYFQNIPGVNVAIPINLELKLIDAARSLYQYDSGLTGFFPIDGYGYQRENLASDTPQRQGENNYWFTTEFRVRFYYKGGEQFAFSGDDDLWVFVNGALVSSCDLGGLHAQRNCTVDMDSLGLTQFSLNEMSIFHAERHWLGSNFKLTTSIIPENIPPISTTSFVSTPENIPVSFNLKGFDPDETGTLFAMITRAPSNGTLSVSLNTWFPVSEQVTFYPDLYFYGTNNMDFILSDGKDNSTSSTVFIEVSFVDQPPIPQNETFTIAMGESVTIQLVSFDPDTPKENLTFYLANSPDYGYCSITEYGMFTYDSVNSGIEVILWQITDDAGNFATGNVTIEISSTIIQEGGVLRPGEVAGIVVGSMSLIGLVGVALVFFLYNWFMAAKFEATWQEEFYQTQATVNPLYKPKYQEKYNPLYKDNVFENNAV